MGRKMKKRNEKPNTNKKIPSLSSSLLLLCLRKKNKKKRLLNFGLWSGAVFE